MAEQGLPITTYLRSLDLFTSFIPLAEWCSANIGVLVALFVIVAGRLVLSTLMQPQLPVNAPPRWSADDWPLLGTLRYFTQPIEMIHEASSAHPGGLGRLRSFSFFLGRKHVVCVGSAANTRRDFLDSKDISLLEGTAELMTALPLTKVQIEKFGSFFGKHLAYLLRHENLSHRLHLLEAEARGLCLRLRSTCASGNDYEWRGMNTFDVFYSCVYGMTMSVLGADEVAADPALRNYTLDVFSSLEHRNPRAKICVPWLPDPAHYLRIWDGFRLYRVFRQIMRAREHSSVVHEDALQHIMNTGANVRDTMGFILNALFAGQKSTGVNASWLPVFLSMKPEWKKRAVDEVEAVIARYRTTSDQKAADVLDTLPLHAWETEFPILVERCLRECVRITLRGVMSRKNVTGADVRLRGDGSNVEVIPDGAFAILAPQLIHLDPNIYSNPHEFDPDRYEADRAEDKKTPYAYLGYGAGRHPCTGMRFAKLQVTISMAYFLSHFEFDLAANARGTPTMKAPPMPDFNANLITKPRFPIFLRYKPRPGLF